MSFIKKTAVAVTSVLTLGFSAGVANAGQHNWDQVAECESGQNWSINTGNGYYGGLQHSPSTWAAYGGHEFAPNAHLASKDQQITVAERVLAGQGAGAWPTCGKLIGYNQGSGVQSQPAQPEVNLEDALDEEKQVTNVITIPEVKELGIKSQDVEISLVSESDVPENNFGVTSDILNDQITDGVNFANNLLSEGF